MVSLQDVKRLAKKVHPEAYVVKSRKYSTKEQQESINAERKQRRDNLDAAKERMVAERKAGGSAIERNEHLLQAAHFVVDVNGDDPAIPQLKIALAAVAKMRELQDAANGLNEEVRSNRGHLFRKYQVWKKNDLFITIVTEADTLDELEINLKEILGK